MRYLCLSLHQPWASLLVHGVKRIETRSWPTRHVGPLLIHAAASWTAAGLEAAGRPEFRDVLTRLSGGTFDRPKLPLGAFVGTVQIDGCVPTEIVERGHPRPGRGRPTNKKGVTVGGWTLHKHDPDAPDIDRRPRADELVVPDLELLLGDFRPGRFAFLCSGATAFEKPVPAKGRQRFWNVDL